MKLAEVASGRRTTVTHLGPGRARRRGPPLPTPPTSPPLRHPRGRKPPAASGDEGLECSGRFLRVWTFDSETGTDARDGSFARETRAWGMRVLLAEDNAMNQQMARFSIVKCGANLDVASHGGQAVDLIRRRLEAGEPNYDCVLMDMMMPVLDGAAATSRIRELERMHEREACRRVMRRSLRERRTRVHSTRQSRGDGRCALETVLPGDASSDARERTSSRGVPGIRRDANRGEGRPRDIRANPKLSERTGQSQNGRRRVGVGALSRRHAVSPLEMVSWSPFVSLLGSRA